MEQIIKLRGDIWQVDLLERGIPGWTCAYFIKGAGNSGWMLIETGPASSAETLFLAAAQLGISPGEVKHIGVTHIHLDHAGGLGVVSRFFYNAEIWVHPRGRRHLADPARLLAGSRAVYGPKIMREYGEVLPVPAEKLRPAGEGTTIRLADRSIVVWETPGHARHHLCFYDRKTRGLFCGDAAGIYAPRLSQLLKQPLVRPATPGPDFNGELMLRDLYRFASSELHNLYFSHFGAAAPAQLLLELVIGQLCIQLQLAAKYIDKEDAVQQLSRELQEKFISTLLACMPENMLAEGLEPAGQHELKLVLEPLHNCASGLLTYLKKCQS